MNGASGENSGHYKVIFDDGTDIRFTTPKGELTGLTFGEKKF
jgi:hypothetical protein